MPLQYYTTNIKTTFLPNVSLQVIAQFTDFTPEESLFVISQGLIAILLKSDMDLQTKINTGWALIVLLSIVVLINLAVVCKEVIKGCKVIFAKVWKSEEPKQITRFMKRRRRNLMANMGSILSVELTRWIKIYLDLVRFNSRYMYLSASIDYFFSYHKQYDGY